MSELSFFILKLTDTNVKTIKNLHFKLYLNNKYIHIFSGMNPVRDNIVRFLEKYKNIKFG